MSDNQKQVAAWLAVAILATAVAMTVWLAVTSTEKRYLDTSDPELVGLTSLWTVAGYFIKNGTLVNSLFAAVLAVLSVAVTLVADIYTRKRDIAIVSALCLAGVAAAAFALAQMSKTDAAGELAYYGEFTGRDAAGVEAMVRGFFGGLIGWVGKF